MSLGKLNYDSLNEEFCYWYYKVNSKFPDRATKFSKLNLIKKIWQLKRSAKVIQENNPYSTQTMES